VIYHYYPEYTPPPPPSPPPANDSDPLLLQASSNWARDAADLRQQISDYLGPAGTNIELVCTENNSDAGALGRQLTSLVNGLYLADSLSQLMKTEFNACLWWDLRNGQNNNGSFDPTLYGWRTYGDEGIIYNSSANSVTKYPTFYAMKLMQFFARPGDTVLGATSDYLLLSTYAVRHTDGSLAVLVINKDNATNFNGQIRISNYVPWTNATIRSYGIPQDEAARTNGNAQAQDISTTDFSAANADFTYSFPPYSLTLFTFPPAAPVLTISNAGLNQVLLQIHGQSGVPYVMEQSTDTMTWLRVSTNMLTGDLLNMTNPIASGPSEKFWRAAWQP
ncbi:MAG TPA: hypothetical protein VKA67_05810, partial [Verrucomicrobiae bacterium]|nr:hypothetical protein [Verrucomicrobiae bacterium]